MTPTRSWIVLADGWLTARNAKTAHGVIRYARDPVAAVIDRDHAGKSTATVMPDLGRDVPIVASLEEAVDRGGTSLLLGVATPGGWIPDSWRPWVLDAARAGLEIVNGLHRFLRDDAELVETARASNAKLWDVREPPSDIPLSAGRALESSARVVLTVGSDCAVGKMTVSLELEAAARAAGMRARFVATGQTGIMIAGEGIAVDRVISDFVAGAAERLVVDSAPGADVLLVEGQGSLWHPSYSGVTLGLLHGSAPEALVFCHRAGHRAIEEPPFTPLPPLTEMIETYESMAAVLRPAPVACIAVNCARLSDGERARALDEIEKETGRPAGDVLRGDAPRLWEAIAASGSDA